MNRLLSSGVLIAIVSGILLALVSCAKVGAPPGGPEDKTGPSVTDNYPVGNSVSVSRRMTARLVFSEPVNKASVEAALFLSPDPRDRLRYRWRGETLELIYMDSLDQDRTYVISVGSQAKDLRGNPMGITFTVAFSTGTQIDHGSISGWIADAAAPQAVSLWAYRVGTNDTVDPCRIMAEYRLQAGGDGDFRFEYMKAGRYRVFAVLDRNLDGLWNPPGEWIASPPWDVEAGDSLYPWVSFRLSEQDTLPARIQSVKMVHQRQYDVRMNRAVTEFAAKFISPENDTLHFIDAYADTSGGNFWRVFLDKTPEPGPWTFLGNGRDSYATLWEDRDSVQVRERADTSRPRVLSTYPSDKSTITAVPETLIVEMDEPVRLDSLMPTSFVLMAADTDSVMMTAALSEVRRIVLKPDIPLQTGMRYQVRFNGKTISDYAGNLLSDTTATFRFGILSEDSLGVLVGNLSTDKPGRYFVRVLELRKHLEAGRISVSAPGPFRLEKLPSGKYVLEITGDWDDNGMYTYGRIFPFSLSEPFFLSPDTVSVRARWEYETRVQWPNNYKAE